MLGVSSVQPLHYNTMLEPREERPPPKGFLKVFERPSCMSCSRFKSNFNKDERDTVESPGMGLKELYLERKRVDVVPTCAFLGKVPSHKRLWGIKSCEGYDPRPVWDFAMPNAVAKEGSGAMLMAPSNSRPTRKSEPRDVVVLIPPGQSAIIVPPRPSSAGGGCQPKPPDLGSNQNLGDGPVDARRLANAEEA